MDELISTPLTADQLRALQHLINDRIHSSLPVGDELVQESDKCAFHCGFRQAKLMAQHAVCDVLEELSRERE